MNDSVYAVVAYIARYWFAVLAMLILWRAVVWLRKDAERVSEAVDKLPDAGFIGEWVVVASEAPEVPEATVFRATRDGWIGSARACDICLKDEMIPSRAARFFLRKDGLHVQPERTATIVVDDEIVRYEAILRHGAVLSVGGISLQLRLFAGVLLSGETPVAPILDDTGRLMTLDVEEDDDDADWDTSDLEMDDDPFFGDGEAGNMDGSGEDRVTLPKPALTVPACRIRRRMHGPAKR